MLIAFTEFNVHFPYIMIIVLVICTIEFLLKLRDYFRLKKELSNSNGIIGTPFFPSLSLFWVIMAILCIVILNIINI